MHLTLFIPFWSPLTILTKQCINYLIIFNIIALMQQNKVHTKAKQSFQNYTAQSKG